MLGKVICHTNIILHSYSKQRKFIAGEIYPCIIKNKDILLSCDIFYDNKLENIEDTKVNLSSIRDIFWEYFNTVTSHKSEDTIINLVSQNYSNPDIQQKINTITLLNKKNVIRTKTN